jgi:hypothetical protein
MMFVGGAQHARLRNICSAAFTPRKGGGTARRDPIHSPGADRQRHCFRTNARGRSPSTPCMGAHLAELLGNFQHNPTRVAEIVQSPEELKSYVAARIQELASSCGWPDFTR